MRTTIESDGSLVVPEEIRAKLGLAAGGEVDLTVRDGVIEIAPAFLEIVTRNCPGGPVEVETVARSELCD